MATVRSVRQTVGDRVDILVVNDASYDGFPYGERLAPYGVHYVLNRMRLARLRRAPLPYALFSVA